MNKWLVLAGILAVSPVQAIEQDKLLHAGVSTVIGAATLQVTDSKIMSYTTCLAVGTAKELYDKQDYGKFDEKDLIADAVGCIIGIEGSEYFGIWTDNNDSVGLNVNYTW